jgi:hypothetical protein
MPKSIDTKVGKYKWGLGTKNTLLLNQNKLGIYKKVSIPIVNIKVSSLLFDFRKPTSFWTKSWKDWTIILRRSDCFSQDFSSCQMTNFWRSYPKQKIRSLLKKIYFYSTINWWKLNYDEFCVQSQTKQPNKLTTITILN